MHRPALSYLLSDLRRNISVPIRDGGNPSPSGEARSSKSAKGTSYPPSEVGGFKNEAGALNRIQFDAPAVTPRLEAGGCLVQDLLCCAGCPCGSRLPGEMLYERT